MNETHTTRPLVDVEVENCQAIPAAALRGYRQGPDRLCASKARETVIYHGRLVPVCEMHRRSFNRAAESGSADAAELAALWEWPA